MAINYNQKDENVKQIEKSNKLNDFKLKYNYRVYGLKQAGNPPVLIELVRGVSLDETKLRNAAQFFINKGIRAEYRLINEGKHHVYLGIRRDVRDKVDLCNKIVTTLVYAVENNVDLTKGIRKVKKAKYS